MNYELIAPVKESPNAGVYIAEHDGAVALVKRSADGAQLENEHRVLSALDHDGIPKVYGLYKENGESVLIREYIAGEPLDEFTEKRGGRLDTKTAAAISIRLCGMIVFCSTQKNLISY